MQVPEFLENKVCFSLPVWQSLFILGANSFFLQQFCSQIPSLAARASAINAFLPCIKSITWQPRFTLLICTTTTQLPPFRLKQPSRWHLWISRTLWTLTLIKRWVPLYVAGGQISGWFLVFEKFTSPLLLLLYKPAMYPTAAFVIELNSGFPFFHKHCKMRAAKS